MTTEIQFVLLLQEKLIRQNIFLRHKSILKSGLCIKENIVICISQQIKNTFVKGNAQRDMACKRKSLNF